MKGQVQHVFIYILTIIVVGLILLLGYKSIGGLMGQGCDVERATFASDLESKIESFSDTALNAVKEKANDIFAATKLTWIDEINKYEKKTGDYFQFKKNAIENIRVENIRKSKLKTLDKEKMQAAAKFQMRRNIVPKLDLYQVAYVEFV